MFKIFSLSVLLQVFLIASSLNNGVNNTIPLPIMVFGVFFSLVFLLIIIGILFSKHIKFNEIDITKNTKNMCKKAIIFSGIGLVVGFIVTHYFIGLPIYRAISTGLFVLIFVLIPITIGFCKKDNDKNNSDI